MPGVAQTTGDAMLGASMGALFRRAVLAALGTVLATLAGSIVAGLARMLLIGAAVIGAIVLVATVRRLRRQKDLSARF